MQQDPNMILLLSNLKLIKSVIKSENILEMKKVKANLDSYYSHETLMQLQSLYSWLYSTYLHWFQKLNEKIQEMHIDVLDGCTIANSDNVDDLNHHNNVKSNKFSNKNQFNNNNDCTEGDSGIDICENCQRAQVNDITYKIKFQYDHQRNSLIRRKKFRFVECSKSTEYVILCDECAKYLTQKNGNIYKNMWPSFIWYVISNVQLNTIYGLSIWKFIPESWRNWWRVHVNLSNLPSSLFIDQTKQLRQFQDSIKSGVLSKIADACNKYLIPNILCPWGCSEYIHKNGFMYIDLIYQRYMNKFQFDLINKIDDTVKCFSSRDDYVREDKHSYENLLLNPSWKVLPGTLLCQDKGAVILTCCNHGGGTNKKYIHPPRYPFMHNLPSEHGDQLCHVVIKPRSISPMKASKYSNTYQMHEQKGCYQGIDTCSLTRFHDFSYWSHLLHQSECLSISNRSDIVALLHKLKERSLLSNIEKLKSASQDLMKNINIGEYYKGATYISLEDAMALQKKISKDIKIPVINDQENIIYCRRNWLERIIYAQKCNEDGYGAQFAIVPNFRSKEYNTQILWNLVTLISSNAELWNVLDNVEKKTKNWHGWMMTFITKHCFHDIIIKGHKSCPFKYEYINTTTKFMKKMNQLNFPLEQFEDVFAKIGKEKEIYVQHILEVDFSHISQDKSIIILIGDHEFGCNFSTEFFSDANIQTHHFTYELRFFSIFDVKNMDDSTFMRHGKEHLSWWEIKRMKRLPIQSSFPKINTAHVKIAVYVQKETMILSDIRDDYMKYIGGQSNIFCKQHHLPLIVLNNTKNVCVNEDGHGEPCKKGVIYGCPNLTCGLKICKMCFLKYPKDEKTYLSIKFNINQEYDIFCKECKESDNESTHSQDSESSYDVSENDKCFEKVVISKNYLDDDSLDEDEDIVDIIPTTNIVESGITISTYQENEKYISGHVILNQCGSLLSRSDNHIISYKSQKHFLQRLASTLEGETIPLLYPEAMMFPSIFWKLFDSNKSFPGALPSSLLSTPISSDGFASIKSHIDNRLTSIFTSTSTNPTYISFLFDILSNLLLNNTDSRIILHRGLTCCDGNIGISIRSSGDTSLHDSIDSKQIVKNLCASQKYLPMNFFITFTVNQMEHFGVKKIKQWVDSTLWEKHYNNYTSLSFDERMEVRKSLEQAAAPILLRNWMETRTFLIDYIYDSKTSPYHPVKAIFARDEYQKDKGNLPHIHLILSVDMDNISEEKKLKINDLIRASICSIRSYDEVNELIKEGVFKSWEDIHELQDLGAKILSHKCDERCKRRVNDGDDPSSFRCRKLNNLRVSPDNTTNSYISIETKRSQDCIDRLIQIGLAEPQTKNEFGVYTKFRCYHKYFHPKRHIPPTNPNDDLNISPVEGYTFSICRSMQNVQNLTHTNGLNRYVCKYIGKIDEQNKIFIKSHPYKDDSLVNKSTFLYNTKIASSSTNEEKKLSKQRNKYHPKGRAISIMEMLQIMLSYPQVRTDMIFEIICTLPLEQRPGVEKTVQLSTTNFLKENYDFIDINNERDEQELDGMDISVLIQKIRKEKKMPKFRNLSQSELIMLQGAQSSRISIDKVTKFSLRPPELRVIVRKIESYFRWFYIHPKQMNQEEIEEGLHINIRRTIWVDDLQKKVSVRKNALPEIMTYLSTIDINSDSHDFLIEMHEWFHRIYILSTQLEHLSENDKRDWDFISHHLLHLDEEKHLPIPVFSYIKPTMGSRFILHILLSMGEFDTEVDLLLHKTLRESLRYAKLIGTSDDPEKLKKYSDQLLKMFIEEQLVFYPNSSKVIDSWIVSAGELLDGVIIRNEIPITDMPPVLQTQVEMQSQVTKSILLQKLKKNLISAITKELDHVSDYYNIPDKNDIENSTVEYPEKWDALKFFNKTPYQSEASYLEQKAALTLGVKAIDTYLNGTQQTTFTKCVIIAGAPGSGKSFLELYLALYSLTKGLNCCITAVMSKRAIQLGGIHLHKLFCLPGHNKFTLYRLAEMAIISLQTKGDKFFLLKILDILFIDEIGQVSSELLGTLDIILRKIRMNDIFFGGLLIISTLDHKQLPPVRGKPFLTSSHILSCFESYILESSVRAHDDHEFSRLQSIARMSPQSYIENPKLLETFKSLLSTCCTFVSSWDSHEITPDVHRIYGKKHPAREASDTYVNQVKSHLNISDYVEVKSQDVQLSYNSHEEWQTATERTSKYLNRLVKEPETLLFFRGAKFIFTYNDDGKFSQSQIGLLLEVPTHNTVNRFKKISILVSPPGLKDVQYDPNKSEKEYLDEGWTKHKVGSCRETTHSVEGNIKAQRKQYGLKPNVTSTVHASMGDTLHKVATEVSLEHSHYMLWDKAQVIVLLSRTRTGKDLIFVGNKIATIKALCNLVKGTSQWADYMENVLHIISVNGERNKRKQLYIHCTSYPFRMKDFYLPVCKTGFVYMLVSTKDHNQNYIGQTKHIQTRLKQHNSGYGASYTAPLQYRPWFLLAYVCGFDNNLNLMLYFESRWKKTRSESISVGQRDPKVLAMTAQFIIDDLRKYSMNNLRLLLLFRED